jgi:hypothetical protein
MTREKSYMERTTLPSKEIISAGYDPKNKTMEVELPEGEIIQFFDVPENVFARFLNAKSFGTYYINKVKYIYHYQRVEV